MAKKLPQKKKNNRAYSLSSVQNKNKTIPKKIPRKINIRNAGHLPHKLQSNEISTKEEGLKQDIIAQSFFDAQSSIKVKCCICDKNLNNSIKIILEPFPKINIPLKKYSLPFELICLRCLMVKIKNNGNEIQSQIFFNESNPHQYTHYRIINKMEEPIFTSDWSFGDEIKLLGALSRLGFGNWSEISNATGKGKFECESHYYTFYYKKENDYIPKINNLLNNNINIKNEKYKIELKNNKIEENKILTKIGKDLGFVPFSIDNNQSNRSININRNNSKSEHPNFILLQNACNTLGYWPKRREFDVEYKNDAELELMEIEFNENDSQNVNNMYDNILMNYNNILDKREERKNFVLEKNLFDVKKQIIYTQLFDGLQHHLT